MSNIHSDNLVDRLHDMSDEELLNLVDKKTVEQIQYLKSKGVKSEDEIRDQLLTIAYNTEIGRYD